MQSVVFRTFKPYVPGIVISRNNCSFLSAVVIK